MRSKGLVNYELWGQLLRAGSQSIPTGAQKRNPASPRSRVGHGHSRWLDSSLGRARPRGKACSSPCNEAVFSSAARTRTLCGHPCVTAADPLGESVECPLPIRAPYARKARAKSRNNSESADLVAAPDCPSPPTAGRFAESTPLSQPRRSYQSGCPATRVKRMPRNPAAGLIRNVSPNASE